MALSAADARVLAQLVDEAHARLAAGDRVGMRQYLDEAADIDADAAGVQWLCGELALADGDLPQARACLQRAVEADPTHADAHWALGRTHEELGEHDAMLEHYAATRRLDAKADRLAGVGGKADFDHVEAVAERVLADLPEAIAQRLGNAPVVLETRPSAALVGEGFDPRALGLFEGAGDFEQRSEELAVAPTRIVLFVANLLAVCPDDATLAEQIEVTVLHEIGHYFGLDEDEVDALGLA